MIKKKGKNTISWRKTSLKKVIIGNMLLHSLVSILFLNYY